MATHHKNQQTHSSKNGRVAYKHHTFASPKARFIIPQNAAQTEGAFRNLLFPVKHSFVAFCEKWSRAFLGSLIATLIVYPIIASFTTLFFYFSPVGFALPLVLSTILKSNWYAPLYGGAVALIVTIILAFLRCSFATAEMANMRSYSLLKSRQNELKARLGIEDRPNGSPAFISLSKMKQATGMTSRDRCSESALREVYAAYGDVCYNLNYSHSGLQWVWCSGYINTWTSIHRAEEALIEVEPVATIVEEALHDQEAIENSAINNSDRLLEKLIQAIKDLDPGASVYFKEHQPDKNYEELQQALKAQMDVLDRLVEAYNRKHPDDTVTKEDMKNTTLDAQVERRARGVLREVRNSLNAYRDNLWEGLVRARNNLLISIALTGAITHVLLCMVILLDYPANSNKEVLMAAAAFYLVGAVAGLFGRFYAESTSERSNDDYGLFSARLIATPLLSGLAGVGGVLITVVLPVLSGQPVPGLDKIFTLNSQYLFAAIVFGFTPNLLIKSLQQRVQKYTTELESSKAGGAVNEKK
ncbi:MAG TPA: hypothetical protein DEV72_17530 [Ktedonobacter sp.]|jgi:hypothetical protein|nr:hypothetical protein [Ktedonobacter sp.]